MSSAGSAAWACKAANRPAPPEPRIKTSVVSRSSAMPVKTPSPGRRMRPPPRRPRPAERAASGHRARRSSPPPAAAARPACGSPAGSTRTASASLTSGRSLQRRKPSSLASPSIAKPEREEMQRQEGRQRQPREAVHERGEPERIGAVREPRAVMAAPRRRRPASRARASSSPNAMAARSRARGAERRPFGQHGAQPDRGVHGRGSDEHAVERRPGDAAAGARENVGGGEPLAHGVEDDRQMHQHQRHHERRGQPLPEVEAHIHGLISPLR